MEKLKLNIQKFASGVINLGTSGYLAGQIVWNSTSNGATANNSKVSASLQLRRTNSYTTTGSWTGNLQIGGDNRNFNWYGSISSNWVTVASFSIIQPHNNDGSGSCYIGGSGRGPSGTSLSGNVVSGSQNVNLDKILRNAVTNSVSGNDIEGKFKVNYTSYVSNFIYKLRISIPGVKELEKINYQKSNEEILLSSETLEYLYTYTNKTKTVQLGFAVETWNGDTKLSSGNEINVNCNITNANPIFNDFEFEDINSKTLALTGNSKYNVNGYSTIRATISELNKAIAQKGANISKYRFIIGNISKDIIYSDTEDVYGDLENSPNGTYNVYAIDSRNNSTLVTKLSVKNIDYKSVDFNSSSCKVERDNGGVGKNAILTLSGYIWNDNFGIKSNSIKSIGYKYKKTTESTWNTGPTIINPILNDNSFSFSGKIGSNEEDFSFDIQSSYDFIISISDELSTKEIQLTPMSSAIPNIALADNGVGIMGDYDEEVGGLLQVGGVQIEEIGDNYIKFYNGTMICCGNAVITSPTYADWYGFCRITNTFTTNLPIAFKDNNYHLELTSKTFGYFGSITVEKNIDNFIFRAFTHNQSAYNPGDGYFDYIAIGRWK